MFFKHSLLTDKLLMANLSINKREAIYILVKTMYVRPRHDAQAIAHARTTACTNQEKGGLGRI